MADNSDDGEYEVKKSRGRPKKEAKEDAKAPEKRGRARATPVKEDKKAAGDDEPAAKRGRGRPKGSKKGKGRTKSPAKPRAGGRGRGRPKKGESKAESEEEGSESGGKDEDDEDDDQE